MAPKNLQVSESAAYSIDVKALDQSDDVQTMPCPRCGKPQPRRARTVCNSCKRFVPTDVARQHWKPQQKIQYPEIETILGACAEEQQANECSFKKSRHGCNLIKNLRSLAIVASIAAVTYFGTPYALKATMGETGFKKLQKNANQTISKILKQSSLTQQKRISYKADSRKT